MRLLLGYCVLAACVAISGCGGPGALTRGTTQEIVLRTSPAGATCTVTRNGAVMATVEATPGAATIERRGAAIEVSCTKKGYFEQSETFVSEWAGVVEQDEGVQPKPAPVATAIGVAATATTEAATYGAAMIGAGGYAAVAVAPAVVVAGLFALPAYGLYQLTANPPFAFRRLPEIVLTPATFESESERDAYFMRRAADIETAAAAERTRAQAGQTCGGAYCSYLLAKIDAGLKLRLDRLAAERTRARVGAGPDSAELRGEPVKGRCPMKSARGFLFLAGVALAGRVTVNQASTYPADWPPEQNIVSGKCPIIAGRYLNEGAASEGLVSAMAPFLGGPRANPNPNHWGGDFRLAANFTDDPAFLSARSIEIQQPNPETLVLSVPDNKTIEPRVITLNDLSFRCNASGLTLSKGGNVLSGISRDPRTDAMVTAFGFLSLSGGIASSSRSFRPIGDGSLMMDVTNSKGIVRLAVFVSTAKGQGFVRWLKDTADKAAAQTSP